MSDFNKIEKDNINVLSPFKLLVLQNFPFIEADFDDITNYQLMCKMVEYMNNLNSNVNTLNENENRVYNAFNEIVDYINNYFDNLDVQEEINNKLDEMTQDGSLTNLIKNYIDPIYQEYENSINSTVEEQNNKINLLYNIKPTVVTNLSQMTDTNKIYLLTTDGNWYYYNGSAWVSGGSYQGIVLDNNAVSYVNLDTYLQANFNVSYSAPLESVSYAGYCKVQNNRFTIDTNADYQYEIYSLEVGKTYIFNIYNSYAMCGLLIIDANQNIIYNSNTTGNQTNYDEIILQIKQSGLSAYISHKISYDGDNNKRSFLKIVRELNDISNNLKINTNVRLLKTIEGYDLRGAGWQMIENADSNVLQYAMDKGKTYHIKAYNRFAVNGYCITDGEMTQLETSYQTPNPSQKTLKELVYTPEVDGFIFVSTYAGTPSVEVEISSVEIIGATNNLFNKKVLFYGDSITANNGSWADSSTIAQKNSMNSTNYGVGGMTFTVVEDRSDTPTTNILLRIQNTLSGQNPDYIILQGGVNDAFRSNTLGNMSSLTDFTSELDTDNFSGAFETAIRYILTNAPECKLGFIINNNIPKLSRLWNYMERTKEICDKYSVPVLDLFHGSGLCAGIPNINNEYYQHNQPDTSIGDQTHPTPTAYEKYINSKVESFMNSL